MIKLLLPKNVFVFSSFSSSPSSVRPLVLQICHFSTSLNNPAFLRHHDDETRNVPISVWWEFDNCNLPAGVNGYRITHCITEALRANGIKGPLQIRAFGDVLQLSTAKQDALSSTGINLIHIPNGGKNYAHGSLLVDLMHWVSKNPPPAHLFLITGNRVFADLLHRLRLDNYNILLATPARAPNILCNAATIMWHWNSLIKGENLDGTHCNHPPDGPDGSWYGHHKVPLEDPFLDGEQSQIGGISEPNSDLESGSIPKAVLMQVQQTLNSYTKGISVSDLRSELAKAGICLDKDYYGHKKFSRFLSSVAGAQLWVGPDKNLFVRCVPQKCPDSSDSSFVPSTVSVDYEELNQVATSKLSGEGEKMVRDAGVTPLTASSHELNVEDIPEKVQQVVDVANAHVTRSQLPSKKNEIHSSSDVSQSAPEKNTTSDNYSAKQSYTVLEKNDISNDISEKLKAEDKYVKPTRKEADAVCHIPNSSPVDESALDKSIGGRTETYSNNFGKRLTFLGWIKSWWPFRKNGGNTYNLTAHQNEPFSNTEEPKFSKLTQTDSHSEESELSDLKQTVCHSEEPEFSEQKQTVSHSEEPKLSEEPEFSEQKQTVSYSGEPKLSEEPEFSEQKQTVSHSEEPKLSQTISHSEEPKLSELRQRVNHLGEPELFSRSSFWSDMEFFVFTSKGSILVSQSKSRKDMMHNFQKYGPQVLSSLSENDLLQLVDLIISEKKWLEERPSQTFPFRLTRPVGKSTMGPSHGANGLRSLFLSGTQNNLQKSSEFDVDKKYQSIPHAGVSSPANKIMHTGKSRTDMLADIQKLVSEILREHSDGYNMSMIPKLFLERYGYPLDVQKLGYHKLASLLPILPGVKIESTYIFPTDRATCASGLETSILNTQETNSSDALYYSDRELSDSYPKDDSKDTLWEELGPVSVSNSNQSDLESKSRHRAVKLETSIHPDYEPSLSDDDSSESEGDSSCLTQPEEEGKPKLNVEDSSFLQTLDSFYRSQEGEDSVKSGNADTKINGLTDGLNPSRQPTPGTHSKIHSGENREKQKPLKSYSFVADPVSHKNELIDGILQSLRKSDDLKMQN